MTIPIFVRKTSKILYYILLSLCVGRAIGPPEIWMNHNLTLELGRFIYDSEEPGADKFYELYVYISVISIFSITTVLYILTMLAFKLIRRK